MGRTFCRETGECCPTGESCCPSLCPGDRIWNGEACVCAIGSPCGDICCDGPCTEAQVCCASPNSYCQASDPAVQSVRNVAGTAPARRLVDALRTRIVRETGFGYWPSNAANAPRRIAPVPAVTGVPHRSVVPGRTVHRASAGRTTPASRSMRSAEKVSWAFSRFGLAGSRYRLLTERASGERLGTFRSRRPPNEILVGGCPLRMWRVLRRSGRTWRGGSTVSRCADSGHSVPAAHRRNRVRGMCTQVNAPDYR